MKIAKNKANGLFILKTYENAVPEGLIDFKSIGDFEELRYYREYILNGEIRGIRMLVKQTKIDETYFLLFISSLILDALS